MTLRITVKIIMEDLGVDQGEIVIKGECGEEAWEEDSYQLGCAVAREVAKGVLKSIGNRILQERPKSFGVRGSFQRTRVTSFGEIPVWRRLYRWLSFPTMGQRPTGGNYT